MSIQSPMHRTQVYLTESEQRALKGLAKRSGRSFAAVLRDAVDAYIARQEGARLDESIRSSFGCWRGRSDESDVRALRREWEERQA